MRNFLTLFSRASVAGSAAPTAPAEPAETTADAGIIRIRDRRRSATRKRLTAAGSVVAVGALIGSGFAVQSSVAATNERVAATAALASSTGLHAEQLDAYGGVVDAHAARTAEGIIDGANSVLAAAQGKTDTTALAASVASLGEYTLLAPERVFELADATAAETQKVQAAAAEVDRLAAEKAAAEAAAAAAAQAAREAAAAEAAAAQKAAAGSASRPAAPSDPTGAQAIARDLMASQYGWGADQFGCLVPLWQRESGWNVNAYNASSGATGIPQALPGNKMASAGADWQTNPATQITWGLGYIAGRYGTPCAAWDHSERVGWY